LAVEAAMQAFRCADRRLGGVYLYAAVVDFLRSEVALGCSGLTMPVSMVGRGWEELVYRGGGAYRDGGVDGARLWAGCGRVASSGPLA